MPAGARTTSWEHAVSLYDDDSQLVDSLAEYVLGGWSHGAACLVIATPAHRDGLRRRLAAPGLTEARAHGRFVELDAAHTLALFMRNGSPEPVLFDRTVGELARQHAADGPLRAFGEMVDLLWEAGNVTGALELERLWGRLQETVVFSLLCAYAAAHLDAEGRARVVQAHDHVVR